MKSSAMPVIRWSRAATLAERADALFGANRQQCHGAVARHDAQLAERRDRQWQQQAPFESTSLFANRLASDRLTPRQWQTLLGTEPEDLREQLSSEGWFRQLVQFEAELLAPTTEQPACADQHRHDAQPDLDLANLFAPAISAARARLRDRLQALPHDEMALLGDFESFERLLFGQLLPALQAMVSGTLVLELNVARMQGRLIGDTPAERYHSFVRSLRNPEVARAILDEYPVLARQVLVALDQWARFGQEFVEHLCADWPLLREQFGLRAAGPVVELTGGAGDRHADGRAVQILKFASGQRLVYKPKSLTAEVRFQELLAWCNQRGANPPLRSLNILDRSDHGWVEFIEAAPCQSTDEISRFYQRQGAYLALLYVVAATDLHFENLVAAGEHPMFIDLEAIFHQRPHRAEIDPATQALTQSVLAVRLLPQTAYVDGIDQPVDFSGLGATAGQTLPYLAARWQATDTDDMRLAFEQAQLPPGHHRPTLHGEPVDLREYQDELLAGFERMYNLLAEHRDELLAADGLLAQFANVEVRHIARITQIYSILLDMSFHPDRLRDALDRDRWLDRLWGQAQDFPTLARLIDAERADLWRNDIPLFTTRPGTRDLFTSTGERIAEYFERSALDIARERIANLGDDDFARQSWLVQATLAILPASEGANASSSPHVPENDGQPTSLAAALKIGDRLAALAWQTDEQAGWLGCVQHPRGWTLGALGLDLATGLPGVVMFLAELGTMTGEDRFVTLALKALNTLRRNLSLPGAASPEELRELIAVLAYLRNLVSDAKFVRAAQQATKTAQRALDESTVETPTPDSASPSRAEISQPRGITVPGLRDGLAGWGRLLLHAAIQEQLMESSQPS